MIHFSGLTPDQAAAYRAGALDAYNQPAEQMRSTGPGFPCRCCLTPIPKGKEALLVAHRPFEHLHPYAETGPIFLCRNGCDMARGGLPEALQVSPTYLVKAYDAEERIIYGSGAIVPQAALEDEVRQRLDTKGTAFVDIRSAKNNCWLARARS